MAPVAQPIAPARGPNISPATPSPAQEEMPAPSCAVEYISSSHSSKAALAIISARNVLPDPDGPVSARCRIPVRCAQNPLPVADRRNLAEPAIQSAGAPPPRKLRFCMASPRKPLQAQASPALPRRQLVVQPRDSMTRRPPTNTVHVKKI
eukprot:scaffold15992_cov118-Isochrysis_galbana.AAC.2